MHSMHACTKTHMCSLTISFSMLYIQSDRHVTRKLIVHYRSTLIIHRIWLKCCSLSTHLTHSFIGTGPSTHCALYCCFLLNYASQRKLWEYRALLPMQNKIGISWTPLNINGLPRVIKMMVYNFRRY